MEFWKQHTGKLAYIISTWMISTVKIKRLLVTVTVTVAHSAYSNGPVCAPFKTALCSCYRFKPCLRSSEMASKLGQIADGEIKRDEIVSAHLTSTRSTFDSKGLNRLVYRYHISTYWCYYYYYDRWIFLTAKPYQYHLPAAATTTDFSHFEVLGGY